MTEQPQNSVPQPATAPVVYKPQPMLESDARTWAALVNVAAILGMVLSGGTLTIVAVLVIWLVFKERSALVDFHGKQQMNLALTTIVAVVVGFIVSLVTLGIGFFLFIPAIVAYAIYTFVMSILAAVAANRGEYYAIPAIIRFIR